MPDPRPTRTKATGQWALGQREPLNANENSRPRDNGLNVRERVEQIYAREGFGSIAPEDLRGRLRWWGLYTQRKPGIDGGRTASLPPEELDDEYFMLRIRTDGGMLSVEQLRTIAQISQRFGRDTADITDRQNIQLHWIRIEDMPQIWQMLEAVGLSTTEACGDTRAWCSARRSLGSRPMKSSMALRRSRRSPPLSGIRVRQPSSKVQNGDLRFPTSGRGPRDQLRVLRRSRAS